ncbi:COP9 signalosome complex subunit 7 [Citrus sinensis]|uniref:COP9 signalosome complex subunit 7 n=1 Tax=Citrus sinensis TaxID=2711 RepID=A0ACB8LUP2_CITSI|nr:COP9 signalosome complex subunit 7 [Citrus sinensis]
MEIEQKQAPLIEQFVKQASTLNGPGPALVKLIVEATSHPSLFAFSEILSVPNLLQLQGTESSVYIDLLRLFAHGTWTDYKSNAAHLPQLVPDQAVKLKQLSVLTLAEMNKVLSYDQLLKELEVANVRELEDFLINECMYVGIVKGKLNQLRRCFEVQFAAGRDLRHGQLENMMQSLTNWYLSVCPFNVVCLILSYRFNFALFKLLLTHVRACCLSTWPLYRNQVIFSFY